MTGPDWMGVSRKHRLDPMPSDLSKIGIIDAGGAEVRDVTVTTLVGTYI